MRRLLLFVGYYLLIRVVIKLCDEKNTWPDRPVLVVVVRRVYYYYYYE
jgi:hypothetical protein